MRGGYATFDGRQLRRAAVRAPARVRDALGRRAGDRGARPRRAGARQGRRPVERRLVQRHRRRARRQPADAERPRRRARRGQRRSRSAATSARPTAAAARCTTIEVPAGTKSLDIAADGRPPGERHRPRPAQGRHGRRPLRHRARAPRRSTTRRPADVTAGTYQARVCEYKDDADPLTGVTTYTGTFVVNDVADVSANPYPPLWRVFPREPLSGTLDANPWNVPSTDTRQALVLGEDLERRHPRQLRRGGQEPGRPRAVGLRPEDERADLHDARQQRASPPRRGPTRWLRARSATSRSRPTATTRSRSRTPGSTSGCNPDQLQPGVGNDISAAVANLFAMHNRMHDWSYSLGFTEENWNMQYVELRQPRAAAGRAAAQPGGENDPVLGQSQAGALTGGSPNFLGRDNANMRPLPDGISSITNMYLWQPIAGAFYAPCVDGDYDMPVIGHEYGHAIENRMIGKGWVADGRPRRRDGRVERRPQRHGGRQRVQLRARRGRQPLRGRHVRDGQQAARHPQLRHELAVQRRRSRRPGSTPQVNPLNFSDLGYDLTGGAGARRRRDLVEGELRDPPGARRQVQRRATRRPNTALQQRCASGKLPADQCPGNRRWIQLVYDAYLLMPIGPSMLEARDAYLAADLMRSSDPTLNWPSNQNELWLEFARHGFGENAFSTNAFSNHNDRDPIPDFASPSADRRRRSRSRRSRRTTATSRSTRGSTPAGTRRASRRSPTPTRPRRPRRRRPAPPRTSTTPRPSCRARTSSSRTRPATATSASGSRSPPARRRR